MPYPVAFPLLEILSFACMHLHPPLQAANLPSAMVVKLVSANFLAKQEMKRNLCSIMESLDFQIVLLLCLDFPHFLA